MKTLFEIPIYAISQEQLNKRVKQYTEKHFKNVDSNIIDLLIFPQRCWLYNHIVGYIRIGIAKQDIIFDLFLPKTKIQRYIWNSNKKIFLYDCNALGTHFYHGHMKTNKEIQDTTNEMLSMIISDFLPKRYFADRSAFDLVNSSLDYQVIIKQLNSPL